MKTATVTFMERNKAKTLTAPLIGIDFNVIILAPWDNKGSSYIKRIKKENVLHYSIA